MTGAATNEFRVTIERLSCHVSVPAGSAPDDNASFAGAHDNPTVARDRVVRLAEREVPAACAEALAALPVGGEGVYRIRRLHLDLWLDPIGTPETEVARRWGKLLAAAVARAIQNARPGQVIRFDSPRDFVTAFLRDLLDGGAWGCWYYAEFRGLERLAPEAVAVELIHARPDWIAPVLLDLDATGHGARLLERWGTGEIDRLWTALGFPTLPGVPSAGALDQVARAWHTVPLSGRPDPAARARDRLRAWLGAVGTVTIGDATYSDATGRAPGADLAAAVHALVDLAALFGVEPELAPLLGMETAPYPALLHRIARGPAAGVLGWLAPQWNTSAGRRGLAQLAALASARSAGRTMLRSAKASEAHAPSGARTPRVRELAPAPLSSPAGSVFLLAPALAETGLWERWRDEVGETAARQYIFALALKALGREQASLVFGDALLATFAGLDDPPIADARAPTETGGPPLAELAHTPWMLALPEIADRWYPMATRDLVAAAVEGMTVIRDMNAGCWIAAWPDVGAVGDATVGDATGRSLMSPKVTPPPAAPAGDLRSLQRAAREPSAEEQALIQAEAAHLQLGARFGYAWLTRPHDAALSAATSLVMRRLAVRLPGFAGASIGYLARQFLAQPAVLYAHPDAYEIRLSGGPLAVILRLALTPAGAPGALAVPWLDRPIRFTLPGEH